MKQPLVTVFIPLYNCETYIRDALDSIVNQTYPHLEILIVDDGSTDHSTDVVESYNDSRIRLIKNPENKGIPYTRNIGLREANGKYMAIMDSDDIAYLNRIEKQVDFMEKNNDIAAIGTYYKIFDGKSNKNYQPEFITSDEIKAGLLFFNRIGNPTSMIRLATLKKHHITYNPEYFVAQDYGMWVQISKVGKLSILPEVLLKYRFGHGNVTKKSQTNKVLQRKRIVDHIHNDILSFYQFDLSQEELTVFNDFFNDNFSSPICQKTINTITEVLSKIRLQNKQNQCFNEELLEKMIRDAVLTSINFRKFNLKHKLQLYYSLCKVDKLSLFLKEMSYLFVKHMYNSVRL